MNILSHKETSMGKGSNIRLSEGHNFQNCKVCHWHALYSTKFNRYFRVGYLVEFDDVAFQILVALEANTTRLTS